MIITIIYISTNLNIRTDTAEQDYTAPWGLHHPVNIKRGQQHLKQINLNASPYLTMQSAANPIKIERKYKKATDVL